MEDLNAVQPIDYYVKKLLKRVKEKYGLDINTENPTRAERLEAALAMKDEDLGWPSMEIMVGRRIDSTEEIYATLIVGQTLAPIDPRKFYAGFTHGYWPEEKREEHETS